MPLRFPGFPVLAVAALPPSACVGISWFLTYPLLGTRATLKTNKIHILELKGYCFLSHYKKHAKGRKGTGMCLGSQKKTMSGPGESHSAVSPPRSPSFLCPWPGSPWGELVHGGLVWPVNRTKGRKVVPSGWSWTWLSLELNWAWKTLSVQEPALPALGQALRGWERPDRQGLCPWELRI